MMRQVIPPKNLWFLPALMVRVLLYVIARLVYSVSSEGRENVPAKGAVLLIPNHISYVDVVLLQLVYPRYIHFVAHEFLFRIWWLGWFLRLMGVVSIQPKAPRQALGNVLKMLGEGRVVCLFPEGQLSRTGCLQRLKPGFRTLAERAGCPVQPAFIDGIWGSVYTFAHGCFWGKRPLRYRHPIRVHFGTLLQPERDALGKVRASLLDLGAAAFSKRPALDENLAHRIVTALAKHPWKSQLVDLHPPRRELSRGKLLGVAIAYSRRIRAMIRDESVGLALPPGAAGAIANLALVLAGKTVVNLDRSKETGLAVKTVIGEPGFGSCDASRILDFRRDFAALGAFQLLGWTALAYLLPGPCLAALLGIPRRGDGRNGSRQLVAQLEQLSSVNLFVPDETFLATSPKFNYRSLLFEWWYPLLHGGKIVSAVASADPGALATVADRERATVLLGEPDLVRAFATGIPEEKAGAPRCALRITENPLGAGRFETMPDTTISILDGLLVQGNSVVSLNLPNPINAPGRDRHEEGNRPGTMGRLLPGVTVRLERDGERNEEMSADSGMLFVTRAGSAEWLKTGIAGKFDDDGFFIPQNAASSWG